MIRAPDEYKPSSFAISHGADFIKKNVRLACQINTRGIPVILQYAVIFCMNATSKSSATPLTICETYEYAHTLVKTLVYTFNMGRIIYIMDDDSLYRFVVYADGVLEPTAHIYR
jgi:hypothetical protein